MKKRQMLSFVLLTSLVVSTGTHAFSASSILNIFKKPQKTTTQMVFSVLKKQYKIFKLYLPQTITKELIGITAGAIVTTALAKASGAIKGLFKPKESKALKLIAENNALQRKIEIIKALTILPIQNELLKKQLEMLKSEPLSFLKDDKEIGTGENPEPETE